MKKKMAAIKMLIAKARMESGEISFPDQVKTMEDCITKVGNSLLFWYNDASGNTKAVVMDIE